MNVDHNEWVNCKCNHLIALHITRYLEKNLRTIKVLLEVYLATASYYDPRF